MYAIDLINQLTSIVTKYGNHPVKNTDDEGIDYIEFDDGDRIIAICFSEG